MSTALLALSIASVLALTGLGLAVLGIRGLAVRRVILVPSRRLLWLLAGAALLQAAASAVLALSGRGGALWGLPVLLAVVVLAYAWKRWTGLWLLGVRGASVRDDLAQALPEWDSCSLTVQPWLGTAKAELSSADQQRLARLTLRATDPRVFGLAAVLGLVLLGVGASLLSGPGSSGDPALGFQSSAAAPSPMMLGMASLVFTGVLVSVRMCEEHIVCLLLLASLFGWAFSL